VFALSEKQLQLGEDDAFQALQSAWEHALESLSEMVNKPSFESWIRSAHPVAMVDGRAVIGTTSRFAKHWLESKHLTTIEEIIECQLGRPVSVKIELLEEEGPVLLAEKLPKKPKPAPKSDGESISQPLNSRYTFDNFVVGPNNRLAHACSMAVAEEPGKTYNPLFIYGGAGLGKTHLLQAIGQAALAENPDLRVVYVSGETFTYHYVTALREHRTAEYRRAYRNVDLWLVDDIQFLAGKERTEEEFFHTFNAIYDMGKQIVLSSDRAPKDLELDKRLLSRFECGMLADIAPPDLPTRMAILQTKAESEHMALPNEVILYIAQLITTNIRQLEGRADQAACLCLANAHCRNGVSCRGGSRRVLRPERASRDRPRTRAGGSCEALQRRCRRSEGLLPLEGYRRSAAGGYVPLQGTHRFLAPCNRPRVRRPGSLHRYPRV
jgi:chromosomal replication initiator protein